MPSSPAPDNPDPRGSPPPADTQVALPSPELIEQRRRSVAMLRPGVWAFRREEAIEVLEVLVQALRALRSG